MVCSHNSLSEQLLRMVKTIEPGLRAAACLHILNTGLHALPQLCNLATAALCC